MTDLPLRNHTSNSRRFVESVEKNRKEKSAKNRNFDNLVFACFCYERLCLAYIFRENLMRSLIEHYVVEAPISKFRRIVMLGS